MTDINEQPKRTLVKKLAEVMAEVGFVEKSGYNSFHKYEYATESDVQNAVQGLLAKRGVIMVPNMIESSYRETKTRNGNTEFIYKVTMEYTFKDGDSGESLTFRMDGEGQDAGDKGIYKAVSGAQKYAIMKFFLIPTGDDPERSSSDQGAATGNNNPKAPNKRTAPRTAPTPMKPAAKKIPEKTPEQKKQDDKQFFEKRDDMKKRIKKYADAKNTETIKVEKYLLDKSNQVLKKEYKSINSINLTTVANVLEQLENIVNADDKAASENQTPKKETKPVQESLTYKN